MDILLVDDHPLVLEVAKAIARKAFAHARIHVASDLAQALKLARKIRPLRLVILDLLLPGCAGTESLVRFRSEFPEVPVLVLSALEDRRTVLDALDAGAAGYVCKSTPAPVFAAALRVVMAGGVYVPSQAINGPARGAARASDASAAPSGAAEPVLTERQFEVLRMVAAGLPNRQIAESLRISKHTVKQHLESVYDKLQVSSRTQAINAAERKGLNLK
jgi:DNA-binding NarL/FixJ family response regulator